MAKDDGLNVVDFNKQRKEKIARRMEENAMINSANRNHERVMEEKRRKEARKQQIAKKRKQEKIKKKRLMKILVKGSTAAVITALSASGAIQCFHIKQGENYIVDKVEELNPTGRYTYWDISSPDEDISKTNGVAIQRGGKTQDAVMVYSYEEADEIMKYINSVIVGNGYPEEWTSIYIEETIGTSRFSGQFKGSDGLAQINTKLKAYEMMKEEEREQKEGISR